MNITLEGKRALVTGASSGIGQAIANHLAAAGARVGINYRSAPGPAEEMAKAIKSKSGAAVTINGDISDPNSVDRMFQQMDLTWGGVDILVNNAGIDGDRALSWDADLAAWRKVLEINLFGAFYCSRLALKRMVRQKSGVIITISSVHQDIAWSGYSAYAASKAGVAMLMKTMAQEAAGFGVRVLSIAPGAIRTPINKSVWSNPKGLKDLLEKIPLNRMGETDEIARMTVVLASDAASYVTGTTIFVDGGMTDYPDFAHGG